MTINHCKLRDVTSTPCLHPNNVVPPKKKGRKKKQKYSLAGKRQLKGDRTFSSLQKLSAISTLMRKCVERAQDVLWQTYENGVCVCV